MKALEFLAALLTVVLVGIGFKYRVSFKKWLNDPRSDAMIYEMRILKKYGVDDATRKVIEQHHRDEVELQVFRDSLKESDKTETED